MFRTTDFEIELIIGFLFQNRLCWSLNYRNVTCESYIFVLHILGEANSCADYLAKRVASSTGAFLPSSERATSCVVYFASGGVSRDDSF